MKDYPGHDLSADTCPTCEAPCVLKPRKRGRKPSPDARRRRVVIYVTDQTYLALLEMSNPVDVSAWIRQKLEDLVK